MRVHRHKKRPWLYVLRGDVPKDWLKREIIGTHYDREAKAWCVPEEMFWAVEKKMGDRLQRPEIFVPFFQVFPTVWNELHDYQQMAVRRAVQAGGRWIFANETGLGKSVEAIATLQALKSEKILIVCPAVARQNWIRELEKWWPERASDARSIQTSPWVKTTSKPARKRLEEAYNAKIQIVSYSLLHHIEDRDFDAIVFDEAHRLKSPTARCSKAAFKLVDEINPPAVLGLTATVVPDRPTDVWNIVNTIWPYRFGQHGKTKKRDNWPFNMRYSVGEQTEYGWLFKGSNPKYKEELAWRLEQLSSRVTKLDVAHLLPPFTVSSLFSDLKDRKKAVVDWATGAIEEADHLCIATHLRATASDLQDTLQKKFPDLPVYCITGAIPPDTRVNAVYAARDEPKAIVVMTIQSLEEAVDLTFCTRTFIAEMLLYAKPMIQFLGRFSRLSGKLPSMVEILVLEGTSDERAAMLLEDKIAAINDTIRGGQSEVALSTITDTSDDWLGALGERMSMTNEMGGVVL